MSNQSSKNLIHALGPASQIPVGEGKTFQVGGQKIAVFRSRDGRLFSTQAFCPHKNALLADGITGSGKLICPLHAYKFDLETGKPVGNGCEPLQTFRIELSSGGDLQLHLETQE